MQETDFSIKIVIKDGGSSDNWEEIVASLRPHFDKADNLELTQISSTDSGAAEAINQAFQLMDCRFLSWLGADDLLFPGSIQAVGKVFEMFPREQWVTGMPMVISETGVFETRIGGSTPLRSVAGYSQIGLAMGQHATMIDLPFVQQEGTFWRSELWDSVGPGLNEDLKLAFDFDLWCRFARKSELVQLGIPLAAFRRRPGQLSSDYRSYQREKALIKKNLPEYKPSDLSRLSRKGNILVFDRGRNTLIRKVIGHRQFWFSHSTVHVRSLAVQWDLLVDKLRRFSAKSPILRLTIAILVRIRNFRASQTH